MEIVFIKDYSIAMKDQFREKAKEWDKVEWKVSLANDAFYRITQNENVNCDAHLVDIGGGTGLLTLKFMDLVKNITIVDTSESMLDVLSQKIDLYAIKNVSIIKDYFNKRLFEANSIDIFISMMTLHHIQDINYFFVSIYKALKVGGSIAFIDLETEPGDFHMEGVEYYHNGFSVEKLEKYLMKTGFEGISIKPLFKVKKKSKYDEIKSYPILYIEATK